MAARRAPRCAARSSKKGAGSVMRKGECAVVTARADAGGTQLLPARRLGCAKSAAEKLVHSHGKRDRHRVHVGLSREALDEDFEVRKSQRPQLGLKPGQVS